MTVEKIQLRGDKLSDLVRIKHGYEILVNTHAFGEVRISKTEALSRINYQSTYQVTISDKKDNKYIGIWNAWSETQDHTVIG